MSSDFSGSGTSDTSAIIDRLLHHAETVLIEGKSHHMKDKRCKNLSRQNQVTGSGVSQFNTKIHLNF